MFPPRERAFWCALGGTAVAGVSAVGLLLGTIPAAHRPAGWVFLVAGVLFAGWGWAWLRRLKQADPGASWPAFLRRELIGVGLMAGVSLVVAAIPEETHEDIRAVMKEVVNAIQMLEAGRGRP